MSPKDIYSKLKRHYSDIKPSPATEGLFELVEPVADTILEACAFTIAGQNQQIAELKAEIESLKQQVNYRGKE